MTIHLSHQGRQLGDFSKEQVDAMLKAGVIAADTLAWTSGLKEWRSLSEILALLAPPPTPQPPPRPTVESLKAIAAPPVIASPPVAHSPQYSEAAMAELGKLSNDRRLGFWCILAWVGAVIWTAIYAGVSASGGFSATSATGAVARHLNKGGVQLDPRVVADEARFLVGCPALILLILGLRGLARRTTASVLAKRKLAFRSFSRDVYLPAIWGTLWRSAVPVVFCALLSASASGGALEGVTAFTTVVMWWMMALPFMLDRPFRYRSRLRLLSGIRGASGSIPSRPAIQAAEHLITTSVVVPANPQKTGLSTAGAKWIFGLMLAFALVSIAGFMRSRSYPGSEGRKTRDTAEESRQAWSPDSNAVVAAVQPGSNLGLAASTRPTPEGERLGDLFPSIERYGPPDELVCWKNPDAGKRYDYLGFTDYPGKQFTVPPADRLVAVYPPGVGPVVRAESPTARVGRDRDGLLFITDTRPGACVVWVGSTNSDSGSALLCANYALLGACGIADQNGHKYRYLQICQGGAWRRSRLTGGCLVYFPVLFYEGRPTSDEQVVQSVKEISELVSAHTEDLFNLFDAAAKLRAKDGPDSQFGRP